MFQDIEGEKRVKNFHLTRIKVLAYNNSFFSSVIKNNETGKLSELLLLLSIYTKNKNYLTMLLSLQFFLSRNIKNYTFVEIEIYIYYVNI